MTNLILKEMMMADKETTFRYHQEEQRKLAEFLMKYRQQQKQGTYGWPILKGPK